jgi:cell wall assembly regulator SMI1
MSADADHFKGCLARLEKWQAKHRRRFLAGLRPGASAAELAALEQDLGLAAPVELRLLLAWHNGQSDDIVGKFQEDWQLMSTTAIAEARKELDVESARTGWQKSWLPFLDDDAGDYLVLDTSARPAPVREFWPANPEHRVVAPSLGEWLDDFVTHVEKGEYVEDSERGTFMRKVH